MTDKKLVDTPTTSPSKKSAEAVQTPPVGESPPTSASVANESTPEKKS